MSATASTPADVAATVLAAALREARLNGVDGSVVRDIWMSGGRPESEVAAAMHDVATATHPEPDPARPVGAPPGWAVGVAHQGAELNDDRRSRGAYYTPFELAGGLVEAALENASFGPNPRVCDPTCGAGAFLLAAAEAMASRGVPVADIGPNLVGFDVDEVGALACRLALGVWLSSRGGDPFSPTIVVADAIHGPSPDAVGDGFDLIVGNPPFLGQLRSTSARSAGQREGLAVARGYADAAAVALERSSGWLRPGGRLTLIQPRSVASARDAEAVRAGVGEVIGLWVDDNEVFDASVRVCAPIIAAPSVMSGRRATGNAPGSGDRRDVREMPDDNRRDGQDEIGGSDRVEDREGQPGRTVMIRRGMRADVVLESRSTTWSELLADAEGVPQVGSLATEGTIGSVASVGADFRQWFYDVADHVAEAADLADPVPLITSGLIDPMTSRWGRHPARVAGTRRHAPAVERSVVVGALQAEHRLVPKLIVANQTRVIETVVDHRGRWLPMTPVISVIPDTVDSWHLAAVLCSPLSTVLAHRAAAGSGLSRRSIRLSARLIGSLPLPGADRQAWDRAANILHAVTEATEVGGSDGDTVDHRVAADQQLAAGHQLAVDAALIEAATAMFDAYGIDETTTMMRWWIDQLPARSQ